MKTWDVRQNTDDWLRARSGIATASDLGKLITPLWKARTGQGVRSYMMEKLAERCMGEPLPSSGAGFFAEQGQILEREAIPFLRMTQEEPVSRVGFVTTDDGMFGASPDALVGEDGGAEIKCPAADTHLEYLLDGVLPEQYAPQVHGSLYVTGRKFWIFMSYNRGFPPLLVRVERDEKIMQAIQFAVLAFNATLAESYAKMRKMAREEDPRPLPPCRQFRALVF